MPSVKIVPEKRMSVLDSLMEEISDDPVFQRVVGKQAKPKVKRVKKVKGLPLASCDGAVRIITGIEEHVGSDRLGLVYRGWERGKVRSHEPVQISDNLLLSVAYAGLGQGDKAGKILDTVERIWPVSGMMRREGRNMQFLLSDSGQSYANSFENAVYGLALLHVRQDKAGARRVLQGIRKGIGTDVHNGERLVHQGARFVRDELKVDEVVLRSWHSAACGLLEYVHGSLATAKEFVRGIDGRIGMVKPAVYGDMLKTYGFSYPSVVVPTWFVGDATGGETSLSRRGSVLTGMLQYLLGRAEGKQEDIDVGRARMLAFEYFPKVGLKQELKAMLFCDSDQVDPSKSSLYTLDNVLFALALMMRAACEEKE